MTAPARRHIATLLLATYGLISAFGSGLHALVDGTECRAIAECPSEGHDPAPILPSSDHDDHCVICHVAEQGQLLDSIASVCWEAVTFAGNPPNAPPASCSPDRLPVDPRGPPLPLA